MFDGRPLKIMKAIGRGGAKEKKEEHEKEKAKPINDKRNLYLAREGCKFIFVDPIRSLKFCFQIPRALPENIFNP